MCLHLVLVFFSGFFGTILVFGPIKLVKAVWDSSSSSPLAIQIKRSNHYICSPFCSKWKFKRGLSDDLSPMLFFLSHLSLSFGFCFLLIELRSKHWDQSKINSEWGNYRKRKKLQRDSNYCFFFFSLSLSLQRVACELVYIVFLVVI